jgi:hypothetical protein
MTLRIHQKLQGITRTALGVFLLSSTFLAASVFQVACEDANQESIQRRVSHRTLVEMGNAPAFDSEVGWRITLNTVLVSVGSVYYFDGDPILSLHVPGPRERDQAPWSFGLVRNAWAHPGHYVRGNAMGEMLQGQTVDVLSGAELAKSSGVTGSIRSARFNFGSPAEGSLASQLGGAVVLLKAVAEKDSSKVSFRMQVNADALVDSTGVSGIEGCEFEEASVQSSGTIRIVISPKVWLDQVDFTPLSAIATDPTTEIEIPSDNIVHEAVLRGLKKGAAYRFFYSNNAG